MIHEGRGRLDFDIKTPNDKEQLTQNLNLLIQHNADRISEEYTAQDLEASPDLAEFLTVNPTKNSENIKMVRFDGIDIQPCRRHARRQHPGNWVGAEWKR